MTWSPAIQRNLVRGQETTKQNFFAIFLRKGKEAGFSMACTWERMRSSLKNIRRYWRERICDGKSYGEFLVADGKNRAIYEFCSSG